MDARSVREAADCAFCGYVSGSLSRAEECRTDSVPVSAAFCAIVPDPASVPMTGNLRAQMRIETPIQYLFSL